MTSVELIQGQTEEVQKLWKAYWRGYMEGKDVESYSEYHKRAAIMKFEEWIETNTEHNIQ